MSHKPKPWEQQEGEPPIAFEYFLHYLKLERSERTLAEAYRRAMNRPDGNPPGSFHERAQHWRWETRALAYDRECDRKTLKALEDRRMKSLLDTADLGRSLRQLATQAAKMIQPIKRTIGVIDGREAVILETKLTPDQILRLAEVGVRLEQLALGNPTDRVQVGEDPNAPVNTDNARDVMMRRLEEMRARRAQANASISAETSGTAPEEIVMADVVSVSALPATTESSE